MRVIPRTVNGRISFYTTHLPKWAEDPEAIGSTPQQIAELQGMLDDVQAAFEQQMRAQLAALAATTTLKIAMDKLNIAGGSAILRIRSQARSSGSSTYQTALIDAPKNGSPIAAPGKPDRFECKLGGLGELWLTWKCNNPRGSQGTLYQVSRSFTIGGPYQSIGTSGKKKYVDCTVPGGTAVVSYRIQAVRSTKKGAVAEFTVSLGVSDKLHPAMMRAA